MRIPTVYNMLYRHYGPRGWWPGDGPFEVMVGAVLTQNTAWTNVERAINNLKDADSLSPEAITAVHFKRLARWLQPSGYFNIKAKRLRAFCNWYLEQGGFARLRQLTTPVLRKRLLSVNGIGPETADDILLYAFGRRVFVIDAYTRRIFQRLGLIAGDESYEGLRSWFEAGLRRVDVQVFNEYHALIVHHGKHVCRTRPACETCCLRRRCARKLSG